MSARTRKLFRESALTTAAALGVLCVITALAAPLLGMKLLVFKSGSMSPEIRTGGLALTRTVPAADLAPGDVVSVTTSEGTRVTHRITKVTPTGDQVLLQLKGDANAKADKETYPVTEADRVVAHVNGMGYVVDALASSYAVFLAGGAAAGLLVLTFRRRTTDALAEPADAEPAPTEPTGSARTDSAPTGRGGRRRATIAAGLAVATLAAGTATYAAVSGGTVAGTLAAFSDSADVTAAASSLKVPAPTGSVDCTNGAPFSGVAYVGWSAVTNPPPGYRYRIDVYTTDGADPVASYTTTDHVQAIGRGDLPGAGTYWVRVSGELGGSTWASTDGITRTIGAGGLNWEINC